MGGVQITKKLKEDEQAYQSSTVSHMALTPPSYLVFIASRGLNSQTFSALSSIWFWLYV